MKTNLVKKILSISIVSLVIALVVATIVLALIPKKLDNPINNGFSSITVYKDEISQTYYVNNNATNKDAIEEDAVCKKIFDLHENSIKDSLLSTLFQGAGKVGVNVQNREYKNAITQAKEESDIVLVFNYSTIQNLYIKGEKYKFVQNFVSEYVTFDRIVMPLNNSDSYEECTIYLADKTSNNTEYKVTFPAHQSEVMEYLESLVFPVIA